MATNKTNLFDKTLNGSFWNAGVTFERTNPTPLEKYSIFKTLEDAKTYASTSPVAYPGQIITVIAGEQEYSDWSFGDLTGYAVTSADGKLYINNVEAKLSDNQLSLTAKVDGVDVIATRTVTKSLDVKPYQIVDTAGTLKPVGDTESLNPTIDALSDAISANTDAISALSDAFEEFTEIQLEGIDAVKNQLTEELSVTVEKQETAEDGFLNTYVIKQGGTQVGEKINIPKDFLVKSAALCADDTGKYIDFVVNSISGDAQESHIKLNVEDLVDVYTGSDGDIVDIDVDGTTVKATVKANSIGFAQLCAEVKEYIDAQDAATYLSAKDYADKQDAATYLSATQYVDTVSATLSDDYVEKIGVAQADAIAKAMEVSSAASAYTDEQLAVHDTATKELIAQVSADAITSALISANAYTDEKIGAIDYAAFAMLSDLESLSDEVSAISIDLTGQIGQTLTDAKDYADQTSANALADAKAYTDELCGSISVTVDQKIADLNISQYAISTDVKAELCAVSAETLVSANDYTDEKVATEAADRAKAIEDLSTALSTDISVLAEDYAAVSADHEGRIDTLETGTAALSGRMDVAEGNITSLQNIVNSTDLSALAIATGDSQKVASKQYVDDTVASIGDVLHFIGVVAVPEGMDLTASEGYQALYPNEKTPTKGDVVLDSVSGNEYVYADNYKGEASWVVIGDENNHATKTELKAEEDARKVADTVLSNAIDNKLFCGNYGNVLSAESLSVVKISQADYHNLVAEEKVDDKVVYIVNNDGTYNMYGETISALSTTGIEGTSEAANTLYVDNKVQEAKDAIPLSVSQLIWDIEEIHCGNATN